MMLRSSSTPVLGSLLSSFSDSPNGSNNHYHDTNTIKHHILPPQNLIKHPYHQSGYLNLTTISSTSSPISPSFSGHGIRRAHSEGNLDSLAYATCTSNEEQDEEAQQQHHFISSLPRKVPGRSKCLMLETIPSFSFYSLKDHYEDEDDQDIGDNDDDDEGAYSQEEDESENPQEKKVTRGNQLAASNTMGNMVLKENKYELMDGKWEVGFEGTSRGMVCEEMYLAKGLGIGGGINNGNTGSGGGGGGGGGCSPEGGDGGDMHNMEDYYKKMVVENPGNPLFLRNYAQFLYQTKQDLRGAEEQYCRAILADPKDGEVLSQYAKLVWDLHHDQVRASSYFERSVQASPQDSHVHAAYARFLWETEEDEDECVVPKDFDHMNSNFHQGSMASATT